MQTVVEMQPAFRPEQEKQNIHNTGRCLALLMYQMCLGRDQQHPVITAHFKSIYKHS